MSTKRGGIKSCLLTEEENKQCLQTENILVSTDRNVLSHKICYSF